MRRVIFAVTAVLFASSAAAGGWSAGVRKTFVDSCVGGASGQNIEEKSARVYCTCVGGALEKKYGDAEIKKVSLAPNDAFTADMQAAAGACAKHLAFVEKPGQGWSPQFRGTFVGSCVGGAAKQGADEKKAQKYCDCMGDTLQKSYSMNAFTQASLSPTDKFNADLQKAAKVCVKQMN